MKKPQAEFRMPVTLVFVRGTEQARLFGSQLAGTVERILGPHPDRRG
ncbi:MAG: hypothetical protein HY293_15450 [Planctomycetes bacterium]|nr:hypothetical protein [Planctomycetota bacterium]